MEKQGTKTNLHQGHRKRLRQRFLEQGLDGLPDINVLELLLFYAQPRQDTNATAHRLMDTFGSLDSVFEAPPESLMSVKGVGESAEFGGLLGYAPIMPVNPYSCADFVNRKGRIPAPVHSFKN